MVLCCAHSLLAAAVTSSYRCSINTLTCHLPTHTGANRNRNNRLVPDHPARNTTRSPDSSLVLQYPSKPHAQKSRKHWTPASLQPHRKQPSLGGTESPGQPVKHHQANLCREPVNKPIRDRNPKTGIQAPNNPILRAKHPPPPSYPLERGEWSGRKWRRSCLNGNLGSASKTPRYRILWGNRKQNPQPGKPRIHT